MYIVYVDESGDSGTVAGSSTHYVLSALVVPVLKWHELLDGMIDLRRALRTRYGLRLRDEIHSQELVNGRASLYPVVQPNERLSILRHCVDYLASQPWLRVLTVVSRKAGHNAEFDHFETAWIRLIERVDRTIDSERPLNV